MFVYQLTSWSLFIVVRCGIRPISDGSRISFVRPYHTRLTFTGEVNWIHFSCLLSLKVKLNRTFSLLLILLLVSGVIGSGLCIFSRFPIMASFSHEYSVSGGLRQIKYGETFTGKGCMACLVRTPLGVIAFFNTHVSHLPLSLSQTLVMCSLVLPTFCLTREK